MAGASLFALLDDIASLLDDVSVLTKVAAKKTAGVLGDDLALNAQQVTGVNANRELPVVWAVAKGSLVNKVILVPAALAISALEAWLHSRGWNVPLIVPLMMIGGALLCFEGVEKLAHRFLHSADDDAEHQAERRKALADTQVDMVAWEKDKVKGAIRTDFILSAEIIVLTLGDRRLRSRPGGVGTVADEVPVGGRHHRHVPGRWRHPGAQRAGAAPRGAGAGRRRAVGLADQCCGQHGGGHHRRCHRAGGGDRVPEAAR